MFPYQIYQALTDQRMRDLRAEARRHELMVQAQLSRTSPGERSSRLRDAVAHFGALLHLSTRAAGGPRATSAMTSTSTSASTAGPIGCLT